MLYREPIEGSYDGNAIAKEACSATSRRRLIKSGSTRIVSGLEDDDHAKSQRRKEE
jgi:hypothetical protein